jgi:hypothetical protein
MDAHMDQQKHVVGRMDVQVHVPSVKQEFALIYMYMYVPPLVKTVL